MGWVIENGRVLRGGRLDRGALEFGREGTGAAGAAPQRFDAAGCWVLPGVVDVHGDAFERIIEPRPGVSMPLADAMREADRQLIACGITTVYHGLTLSWEPGIRSPAHAMQIIDAARAITTRCDTRFNLRWETFALEAEGLVAELLDRLEAPILSLNDHLTSHLHLGAEHRKVRRMAERMGTTPAEADALMQDLARRADEVPGAVARLAACARARGLALFAHDETSPEERARHRALGSAVCEFPMNEATAQAARAAGDHVVVGAPNVVRGGSQNNAICAAAAIRQGVADVLASDYFYPSLVLAALRLIDEGMDPAEAWSCVSLNPARSAGLTDRGALDDGMRADVIVLDPAERRVRAVWVDGRCVLRDA